MVVAAGDHAPRARVDGLAAVAEEVGVVAVSAEVEVDSVVEL